MKILGILLAITGAALFFAGKITAGSLPPNYSDDGDDGFLELLIRVGSFLKAIGGLFVIAGVICFMM